MTVTTQSLANATPVTAPAEGRVVLITGATGSIGHAVARQLATAGFRLALTGRRQEALDRLRDELAEGARAIPIAVTAELTDYSSITRLVDEVINGYGRIDVLVNNAGGWSGSRFGPFLDKGENELAAEVNENLLSAIYVSRLVLPAMLEQRYGRIVNVSSIAGMIALGGHSAYSAAKAGHTGLARQLAVEFGEFGITTNCVAPGAVLTERAERLVADKDEAIMAMLEMTPTGRLTSPEEVAHLVAFLSSDEAANINGQTLAIDGGMTAV